MNCYHRRIGTIWQILLITQEVVNKFLQKNFEECDIVQATNHSIVVLTFVMIQIGISITTEWENPSHIMKRDRQHSTAVTAADFCQ